MRRKYSKARRSLRSTPSPSAYMRPSFHWASAWPCSAAYCSDVMAFSFSPARSACVPERNASIGVGSAGRPGATDDGPAPGGRGTSRRDGAATTGAERLGGAAAGGRRSMLTAGAAGTVTRSTLPGGSSLGVPSSARTGASPSTRPTATMRTIVSDVRIAPLFRRCARMGHGARPRRTHLLGVFPQATRAELAVAWLPLRLAPAQFLVGQANVQASSLSVDVDDVAVAQEPDWPADRRFRPDVADTEPARRAGKTSVGDQRDLQSHALTVEGGRGRQHLAHAGPAARAFVADDQDVAFLVAAAAHRFEGILLAVEAARRSGKLQVGHGGDFHDRAFGSEIALQPDDTPGRRQRLVGRTHHILVGIPLHAAHVLGDRAAGDGHAVAVQEAMIEESFHEERHAASLEQILGDITAAWFQIRDIRCPFE